MVCAFRHLLDQFSSHQKGRGNKLGLRALKYKVNSQMAGLILLMITFAQKMASSLLSTV